MQDQESKLGKGIDQAMVLIHCNSLAKNIIKPNVLTVGCCLLQWLGMCGCGGYKVNGLTGDDEVGDVTGDDVW